MDEILENISNLHISEFRKKYQFDLSAMQPCISETDLRENRFVSEEKIRNCWSWEAVNAELVPAFYRPCIAHPRKAVRNPFSSPIPHPQTSSRSAKKLQSSPTMNNIFRTVKRTFSLEKLAERTGRLNSRSHSLNQERKATSGANFTSIPKRAHNGEAISQ
ncbi:hypothetical protein Aperf_G00000132505 [Anoplocephala perfoliata]